MNWYVIYTKSRREQAVAKELEKIGIETYCPMVTEVRQWSDRKKKVTSPLIKSYVFVKMNESEREKVFEVPGVVQFLFWLGKPAIVREAEIDTLKTWLSEEDYSDVELSNITPGDHLIISKGSFKGKEAIVAEVGKKRLKLILKSLGLVVNVKISQAIE